MGHLFQDSSPWRGWIPAALFALMSATVPLLLSDAWPGNPPPSGAAQGEAGRATQERPAGTQSQTPPYPGQSAPSQNTTPGVQLERPRIEPPHDETGQTPVVLTRKQKDALMKSQFEKIKRDAAELTTLAQSLQEELDKSNEHILSMNIVEKALKIENLAKKISRTARNY